MRTIDAALSQLRQDDPGSCLTRHALRKMILQGRIPHVRAGAKYLVNYDGLLSALAGEAALTETASQIGAIRAVSI
jgi:hypothetical protein